MINSTKLPTGSQFPHYSNDMFMPLRVAHVRANLCAVLATDHTLCMVRNKCI